MSERRSPQNEDWDDFPHLYSTSRHGYAEDIMYFLMSLSANLKLLRLVDENRGKIIHRKYFKRRK